MLAFNVPSAAVNADTVNYASGPFIAAPAVAVLVIKVPVPIVTSTDELFATVPSTIERSVTNNLTVEVNICEEKQFRKTNEG